MSGNGTSENLRVSLRFRPPDNDGGETSKCVRFPADCGGKKVTVSDGTEFSFSFDHVFDEHATQKAVYDSSVAPLIPSLLSGRDAFLLAYGQANSGKTHTLIGSSSAVDGDDDSGGDDYGGGYDCHDDDRSGISSLSSCGVSEVRKRGTRGGPAQQHGGPLGGRGVGRGVPPLQVITGGRRRRRGVGVGDHHGGAAATRTNGGGRSGAHGEGTGVRDGFGRILEPPSQSQEAASTTPDEGAGAVPRAVHDVFSRRSSSSSSTSGRSRFDVICSYVEVYVEAITDLLAPDGIQAYQRGDHPPSRRIKSPTIERGDGATGGGGTYLSNTTEVKCETEREALKVLERGNAARLNGNGDLTRSHGIFIIKIERTGHRDGTVATSRMFLLDLAGSDTPRKPPPASPSVVGGRSHHGAGAAAVHKSKLLNISLSSLGNVVYALSESNDPSHAPYRDSKLTTILEDAVGGSAATSLILTSGVERGDVAEIMSTLRFGQRARKIKNTVPAHLAIEEGKDVGEVGTVEPAAGGEKETAARKRRSSATPLTLAGTSATTGGPDGSSWNESAMHTVPEETAGGGSGSVSGGGSKASPGAAIGPAAAAAGAYEELIAAGSMLRRRSTVSPEEAAAPLSSSSDPSVKGTAAKRMEDDLAVAREELTTVSTLLRSAAKRMEADLSVAREELLSTGGNAAPPSSRKVPAASGGDGDLPRDGEGRRSRGGFAEPPNEPKTAEEMEAEIERAKRELQSMTLGNAAARRKLGASPTSMSMPDGSGGAAGGAGSVGGSSMGQPLHLTARQIEMDLEAARRELLGVGDDAADGGGDEGNPTGQVVRFPPDVGGGGNGGVANGGSGAAFDWKDWDALKRLLASDFGSRRSAGDDDDATEETLRHLVRAEMQQKERLFRDMERELASLRRENEALNDVKKKGEEELGMAKKEIKVLTLRATEAENLLRSGDHRGPVGERSDSGSLLTDRLGPLATDENMGVSNIVGSQYQSHNDFVNDDGTVRPPLRKKPSIGASDDDSTNASTMRTSTSGEGKPVRVCLRLRPMSKLETSRRSRSCVEVHDGSRNFTVDSPLDGEYDFCYDQVFDTDAPQNAVYTYAGVPVASNILAGINCCVMTYGLTGSGKTYTLMGALPDELNRAGKLKAATASASLMQQESNRTLQTQQSQQTVTDDEDDETAGIAPRLIRALFKGMAGSAATTEFTIRCSFVAIYLEKMFDLLEPQAKKTLSVREDMKGVQIEGASEACCFDEFDVISLIQRGRACQSVLSTRMNMDASRSHAIFIIKVDQRNVQTGTTRTAQLHLADLAGFEMTVKAKGQTMQETKIIHKSFSALGNVIKSLTEGNPHAPYRESKLTCVLKDAFGGNCKTTLIITASPSSYNISETINTIRLGQRVRRVVNAPRVNREVSISDYKKWLMMSEVKLGELVAFVKQVAEELAQDEAGKGLVSSPVWESILSIASDDDKLSNPCRKAMALGDLEELKKYGAKWKALSTAIAEKLPSEDLTTVTKGRDRAENLLSDIQSEVVVLRRQNELLVQDKRKKDEELSLSRKEAKLLTLQKSEVAHNLGLSDYREQEAVTFLRYMRKLCWRLQKDVARNRTVDISEITSCITGAPDLTGLVDLDTLLLEAGLIESREVNDNDDDDLPDDLRPSEEALMRSESKLFAEIGDEDPVAAQNEMEANGTQSGRQSNQWANDGQNNQIWGGRLVQTTSNLFSSIGAAPWLRKSGHGEEIDHRSGAGGTTAAQTAGNLPSSHRVRQLQRDLQTMTNKCIELQVLLNEEKATVDTLTNRSGSLNKKRLAQEAIALRKERDRMMHNAKAATWKLQELHVVNKVLAKKSTESRQHVTFLEEGFQRLQETFRTTVLDSLDADSQLRERVASLEAVVDSLTIPQNQTIELDALSRPVPRMNLPIRGRLEWKRDSVVATTPDHPSPRSLMLVPTLKLPEKTPSSSVRRKAKYARRYGSMYDHKARISLSSFGRVRLDRQKRTSDLGRMLPVYEGSLFFPSFVAH